MGKKLFMLSIEEDIKRFLKEDDLERNLYYTNKLPEKEVECFLKFKSDMIISGLPFFFGTFKILGASLDDAFIDEKIEELEGKKIFKDEKKEISFKLPFGLALTGERVSLNLLSHASSISTFTNLFVKKASPLGIKILDTRKTTPGLRSLEKYAVRMGGGFNHRLGQSDTWMVKDNHKSFFGGLQQAISFFKEMNVFYNNLVVEIHSLEELKKAISLGVLNVMLDNFSTEEIKEAIRLKKENMTYEISGGIRLETIDSYLIEGVSAISIGALTYDAPHVDVSLKFKA